MGMRLSERAKLCLAGAALVVASGAASAPALGGSWVYDDWATAEHPAQDGLDDLRAVFARDSSAYMLKPNNPWPMGVTYRPLSMASLIVVQALDPHAPWAHHLLSLALHVTSALGLLFACRRLRGADDFSPLAGPRSRIDTVPLLVAAAFALHPVTIEAYAWINGRSDVLAGAWLAALVCALPYGQARTSGVRAVIAGLCAAGASFSKEPAVAVVAALLVASLLPARGLPDRAQLRASAPAGLAVVVGLLVALLARAFVTRGRVSGASVLLSDSELLPTFAKALTLTIEHLVVPLPRAMLCLSHELSRPLELIDSCVLLAIATLLIGLVWKRRFRSFVLISAVLVSLLPVLMVRHMVWLGFDRYLYLPLLLLGLAGAELRVAALTARARAVAVYAACALVLAFGMASFGSARAYASQSSWLASLVASRPDDASGYIMATSWFLQRKDFARAHQAVLRAPREGLSPALSHDLTNQLMVLGYRRAAFELAEQTYRAHPNAGLARFDALQAIGSQGRFEEAYTLARSFQRDPVFCSPARDWLKSWLSEPKLPHEQRANVERLLTQLRCPARLQLAGQ